MTTCRFLYVLCCWLKLAEWGWRCLVQATDERRGRTLSFKAQGGVGGRSWDDGSVYSTVKAIKIFYGGECIDAIQIRYVDNHGNPTWLGKHGGNEGEQNFILVFLSFRPKNHFYPCRNQFYFKIECIARTRRIQILSNSVIRLYISFAKLIFKQVDLNYPDEYLISIHGCCGYIGTYKVIFSLTFETNQRTLGPYGAEGGTRFSFPTTGLKIVGFHGRCDWYLDAIGFHFLPISQSQKVEL